MSAVGVCLFDDATTPTSGWLSVAGGQSQRVAGLSNLPMNMRWLTNLSWATCRRLGQTNARIKHAGYLRTSLAQLREELGVPARNTPPDRAVQVLSAVFGRTMAVADRLYPGPDERAGALGQGSSLSQDLRARLLGNDHSISGDVDAALENAYLESVVCEIENRRDDRVVVVRPPRIEHAESVLSGPVPSNQWVWHDGARFGEQAQRAKALVLLDQPVLAKAHVVQIDPVVSWLVGYGNTHGRGMDRLWLSHPELAWLQPFAKVEVEGAFIGGAYRRVEAACALYEAGLAERQSFSLGLIAENYWAGLAGKFWDSRSRQSLFSPRAVWLRAQDRFALFCHAFRLYRDTGIRVRSYGVGAIYLTPRDHEIGLLRRHAAQHGMDLPLSLDDDERPIGVLA